MVRSAQDITNYFVELASKSEENDLTNLKLQKLLYYAQGKYLADNDKPLFKEAIEAWDFGPVVRSIYNTYKYCGPYPITTFDKKVKRAELPKSVKVFLDSVWNEYNKYSAGYLVDLTHKQGTPWAEIYNKQKGTEIPHDLMHKHFANL